MWGEWMSELTKNEKEWEIKFNSLEKRVYSADFVKGYDFWKDMEKHINFESKILDYGCGKGDLVKNLFKKGYKNTFGTDPSKFFLNNFLLYQFFLIGIFLHLIFFHCLFFPKLNELSLHNFLHYRIEHN